MEKEFVTPTPETGSNPLPETGSNSLPEKSKAAGEVVTTQELEDSAPSKQDAESLQTPTGFYDRLCKSLENPPKRRETAYIETPDEPVYTESIKSVGPDEPDAIGKFFHLLHLILKNRLLIHIFVGLLATAWWISLLVQKKHRHSWLIPTFIYGFTMLRLITWHTTLHYKLFHFIQKLWGYCVSIRDKVVPEKLRLPLGAAIVIAVMLLGTLIPTPTEDYPRKERLKPFFGIILLIMIFYVTSKHREAIRWFTVVSAMLMQYIVALFVLRTGAGYDFFNFISTLARDLLGFARNGVAFLTSEETSQIGMFFFSVPPAVVFFVSVVYIWYQWGLVQWCVSKGSYFFIWTTRTSGVESAAATAAPFIGQGESAILVARLLPYATSSELHAIMTSGFATIAGSVLASYIALGLNPQAMVSSCIMSIPCSLAMSKLRYPETEHSLTNGRVLTPSDLNRDAKVYQNSLEAFVDGATLGLQVALMIITNTMCVVALVALINALLTWFGNFWNINELTLTLIFGYIFYPVSFFCGVPSKDILNVAKLIALKVTNNEYVGFNTMTTMSPYTEMDQRSKFIATYCLCGFANFGSVGINIGVLKTLAPAKTKQVASLVISALITGCMATITSAAIASMVINDVSRFQTSVMTATA